MTAPAALVLCGGLGTRLRAAVADVPKVLAPVAGRPFLDVLVDVLHRAGIRRVVLLTGYLAEQVEEHVARVLRGAFPDVRFEVSTEPSPLGTGGAVKHAARFLDREQPFLLVNGDTYVEIDIRKLFADHRAADALVTIAAVDVPDAERYGALDVDAAGTLRRFVEKGEVGRGLVNAGVYVVEPRVLDAIDPGRAVSLEREVLPVLLARGERIFARRQPGGFVDIGTVESWAAFSKDLTAREGGMEP